jgi:hypothetical protein
MHQPGFFSLSKDTLRLIPAYFTGVPALDEKASGRIKKQTYLTGGLTRTDTGTAGAAGKGDSVHLLY